LQNIVWNGFICRSHSAHDQSHRFTKNYDFAYDLKRLRSASNRYQASNLLSLLAVYPS
jgi:hypothetical protein